jgi:hypothetical protein
MITNIIVFEGITQKITTVEGYEIFMGGIHPFWFGTHWLLHEEYFDKQSWIAWSIDMLKDKK